MPFSLTKALMRPEPGLPERMEKDRMIDGATDLPDLDGYASSDSVPIVEFVLTRDPIQMLRVARTEEAILAEVRERLARDRKVVANRQERHAAQQAVNVAWREAALQRARENSVSREG